jgi:hypothetical protein
VESAEPLPLGAVRPPDEEDELVLPSPDWLDPLLLFVVEDTAPVSVCIVPISANVPATAASVTAVAVAAVRRAPLRTAATAPRSLFVIAVPSLVTCCHTPRSGTDLREVCEVPLGTPRRF